MIKNGRRMSALLAVCVISSGSAWGMTQYTATDLGAIPGGRSVESCAAVNNSGQIVGRTYKYDTTARAFIYAGGSVTDLWTTTGQYMFEATGINSSGVISGSVTNNILTRPLSRAVIYDGITIKDLGSLNSNPNISDDSRAMGINEAGKAVGFSRNSDNIYHAFIYDGTMKDLGALEVGRDSYALGVNNKDDVVGRSVVSTTTWPEYHAFLYSAGQMIDIHPSSARWSIAYAINDARQVVGTCGAPNDETHAFLYSNGQTIDLSLAFGAYYSTAVDINNSGQVVGQYAISPTQDLSYLSSGAFLYSDGTMANLNTITTISAGWTLFNVFSISDNGMIVAMGRTESGTQHAFLLTPVPEPTTAIFVAIGVATGVMSRRRERA